MKYEESHIAVFLLPLSWLMLYFFLRWNIYLLERTDPIEFFFGKLAFFSLPSTGIYEALACECLIFLNVAEHNGR